VREYAAEKADAGQLAGVCDRHRDWYLRVVEEADPNLGGEYQAAWLDRLDADRANWLSALVWTESQKDVDSATRLAAAVSRFWMLRASFNEAATWLGRVHDMAQAAAVRSAAYAKVLNALGTVAWNQGEIETARVHFEQSLALYRELGDGQRTADLLNNLGNLALDEGDEEEASALLEEALASYRSANDQPGISAALGNLALIALRAEDLPRAKTMYHESLTIDHSMGDSWAIATSLHALGVIACRNGETDEAKAHLEDSLTRRVELGDHAGIAECIEAFGELALSNGHFERALKLWGAASAIRESTGSTMPAADAALHEERIKRAATEVGESTHSRCWNEGRLWSTDEAVRHARA
jgi:tetratricopeptide (TPR) repeat protein